MRGDIYLHIYGGYPHYVNFPGMAFTFDELENIIRDLHDNLKVKKAFITVWGIWENYPPRHWPINEKAGGAKRLKKVFDLAKSYGYLITPYHNWACNLEHDPLYSYDLWPKGPDGKPIIKSRWSGIDRKYPIQFASDVLPKEFDLLEPNATYSDVRQTPELQKYLYNLGIPITAERMPDSELSVPDYHRLEGLMPHNFKNINWPFVEAPLFNLVYHDAIMVTTRWQSPDNDVDQNGDYAVRSLRNMLYGNEAFFVAPPWEYPGIRDYIRNAVELLAPLHEETGFQEMTYHEYLSPDFLVQRSRFANGVEVTVNMGLVERTLPDNTKLPKYGFRIKRADGRLTEGAFKISMEMKTSGK
jgi:hypothetical protein